MKVAIDTNILVRLFTKDPETDYKKVQKFLKKYKTKEVFVSIITLIETGFVLSKCYDYTKDEVLQALELVLTADQFYVEQDAVVRQAIVKCRKGFTLFDSVIGEIGTVRHVKTYTLDRKLSKNASFELLK